MVQLKSRPRSTNEKLLVATPEDFEQFFAKEATELFRLSLLLTADAEKAENCLRLATRDCLFLCGVPRDQVHTWAHRMLLRNAIRLVWPTPNEIPSESRLEFHLQPSDFPLQALQESVVILTLPDLDRLAFVICVLERYSILDCALFLRKAPKEVHDAIARATRRVLSFEERNATVAGNNYRGFWGKGNKLEGSCRSIFD